MRNEQILSNNQMVLSSVSELLALRDLKNKVEQLEKRVKNPESYVVLTGETSSGKSTLLNGLIGKPLLPVSSTPTQADVVEIRLDTESRDAKYYGVDHSGHEMPISRDEFRQHNIKKEKNYSRLLLTIPEYRHPLPGLRIFDTPGFGSINPEHEEVLFDFMPQSDCIIHVISYRAGMRETDAAFIRYLRDIKDPSTGIFLVINNAPRGEDFSQRRVNEIVEKFSVSYFEKPPVFVVESQYKHDSQTDDEMLPDATNLWVAVADWIYRPERVSSVNRGLMILQVDLLRSVLDNVLMRLSSALEFEEYKAIEEISFRKKDEFIDLINRRFDYLIRSCTSQLQQVTERINQNIFSEIESRNAWTNKDDALAYVNGHLIEHETRMAIAPIFDEIHSTLSALDREISELLNTVIRKHYESVANIDLKYRDMALQISQNRLESFALKAATSFISKFGGRGGYAAGVPNLAKAGLKKLGGMFGITFTKDTHNSLAKMIAKLGLNSARVLSAALAVITEGVFYLIDAQTWQKDLKKEVTKVTSDWKENFTKSMTGELEESRNHNIAKINEFFDSFATSFEPGKLEIEPAKLLKSRREIEEAIENTTTVINEV